ncbi:hypothetical protein PSECIP111951_03013 [Pseudoalteromonas holothuriae]|uniref:Uncharacterized protein n=1 Tax=Pseudoalteromonas holothuriae TaxID=2963714 RepID=A0ABM9GL12_9GAMM|nr:hypothetical protein [Pseudoalteromonas sp. CIP111951]CAH9063967.1 hypothetical protein PSECIP111951_03013 [Pseudoalteromonas sp. CIP111951]
MTNITNTPAPLWNGPRFEVPVSIEALMIGEPNRFDGNGNNVLWADIAVNYKDVRKGGDGGFPAPFARRSEAPGTGVHLHWTLPKSLRSGLQLPSSDVIFPSVPDRWLILRSLVDESGETIEHTAWILESNFVGSLSDGGTNAFPEDGLDSEVTYLGKRFDFPGWQESGNKGISLKAIAPGDLGFAAVYDNVTNVFAFFDDMQGAATGKYSYSVVGWYADSTQDILYNQITDEGKETPWQIQEQWSELMQVLGWKTYNLDTAKSDWEAWKTSHHITGSTPFPEQVVLPAQSLYHGLIFNVDWQGPGQSYDTGVPTGHPTIAIGNSPVESIAAWLADTMNQPESERLLNALNLDYIYDFTSNHVRFEEKMHNNEFFGLSAGKLWQVSNKHDQSSGSGDMSVLLSRENTDALTVLNDAQRELNSVQQHKASAETELFACGWKINRVSPFDSALLEQVQDAIDALMATIKSNEKQITALQDKIKKQYDDLDSNLANDLFLEQIEAPRFYQASDPVLMIANAASNRKLSGAGSADNGATLIGRFTGQNMTSLTVTAQLQQGSKTVVFDQAMLAKYVSFPTTVGLPKEMQDLWTESLLVNTNNATLLAIWFFKNLDIVPSSGQVPKLAESIKEQQSKIWNASVHAAFDQVAMTALAKFNGVVPEKTSVQEWEPPWSPLYFDWEVQWYPGAENSDDVLEHWSYGEIDFEWPAKQAINTANHISLQGRTLMNAQVINGLYDKLTKFVGNSSEFNQLPINQQNELKEMIESIKDYDVLTQSLGGFANQMILRNPTLINPLYSKTNQSLNKQLAEINQMTDGQQHWLPMVDTVTDNLPFSPFRSGHFIFKRFWVIDSFGRYLSAGDAGALTPIRAETVATPGGEGNKNYVQITPRWNQPARLNFNLLDANNDNVISNSSELTSPICGWVLSNHLDDALMVYNANGDLLGQVQAVTRDNDTGLRWDPVPGKNFPYGQPPQIENEHLRDLINALLAKGANDAGVLHQLLSVIDATLWQTDGLGKRQHSNLSVLVGYPLAVVRAKTSVGLMGSPAYDQNWSQTGKHNDDELLKVKFPVRVGDSGIKQNGVMGYFADNHYEQFNAVYGYQAGHNSVRMQMKGAQLEAGLSANNYLNTEPLLHLPPDGSTDSPTEVLLTLLVDPRGEIPIASAATPLKEIFLAPGPVARAMENIVITFRTGPILVEPEQIRMPLPGQVEGKWSWIHRTGVTLWQEQDKIWTQQDTASFNDNPPILQQGWLKLGSALTKS